MARFGRDLVRSLTQPAYIGGLFEAGQQLGGLRQDRREKEKEARLQKGLFGLEQMAASGELTPEMYQEALGSYSQMITDEESANKIRETMNRVQSDVQATSKFEAGSALNSVRERMYDVVNDPALPEVEKNKRLAELQVEANTIAKDGGLDPMVAGNLGRTVRQDMFQREQQKLEAKRVAERHDITVDQAEMAVARFSQWEKDVDVQNLANEVKAEMNKDLLLKTQTRATGLSREQFLEANPNKDYLYDEIEAENLERDNRLTEARNKKEVGGFEYTDEELKDIGFKENEIKMIRDIAKLNVSQAHNAIISRMGRIPASKNVSASMIGKIADALLVDIMDTKKPGKIYGESKKYSYGNKEDVEEAKAIAANKAVKVAELMADGQTFELAVETVFAEDSKKADENKDSDKDSSSASDTEGELARLLKSLEKGIPLEALDESN